MHCNRKRPIIDIAPIVDYTGEQIRAIRMHSGLSQRQLAEATGISVTTIQFSETKKNYTPPRYLLRFLEILEQNPHFFERYGIVDKTIFDDEVDDV